MRATRQIGALPCRPVREMRSSSVRIRHWNKPLASNQVAALGYLQSRVRGDPDGRVMAHAASAALQQDRGARAPIGLIFSCILYSLTVQNSSYSMSTMRSCLSQGFFPVQGVIACPLLGFASAESSGQPGSGWLPRCNNQRLKANFED